DRDGRRQARQAGDDGAQPRRGRGRARQARREVRVQVLPALPAAAPGRAPDPARPRSLSPSRAGHARRPPRAEGCRRMHDAPSTLPEGRTDESRSAMRDLWDRTHQARRFVAVGILNTGVDYTLFIGLTKVFSIPLHLVWTAKLVSGTVALSISFF